MATGSAVKVSGPLGSVARGLADANMYDVVREVQALGG